MKIISFLKKIFNFVKKIFRGNNPVEVINNVTKDVVGVATAGIGIVSAINMFRVRIMKKSKTTSESAPCDFVATPRGDTMERLNAMNVPNNKKKKRKYTNADLEALQVLEKSRNYHFRCLTPDRQLDLLKIEGFDFDNYKKEYFKEKNHPFYKLKKNIKKFGKIDLSLDKPFREEVDYGFLNFILRPLDRFVHWYKCDPVPLKPKQVLVVPREKIPTINCESQNEYAEVMRVLNLDKVYLDYFDKMIPDKAAFERKQIMMDEFGTSNLGKYQKRVRKRVMSADYAIPTGLELLDDMGKVKKKKKKVKNKKNESSEKKNKKKKKKSHEDNYEKEANAKVMAMVDKVKKKVEKGEYVY